jgi:hypothetical protein
MICGSVLDRPRLPESPPINLRGDDGPNAVFERHQRFLEIAG